MSGKSRGHSTPKRERAPSPMGQIEVSFQRALNLHQRGLIGQAQIIYQEILKTQPRHFNSRHMLGVAALQSGRTDDAIKLIGAAIKLDASIPSAHNNLGNALLEQKNWKAALACFDKAIAIDPTYIEAIVNRAYALKELERPEEALSACDALLSLRPSLPQGHNNRGNALLELGRTEEALACFETALTLAPSYAEAFNNRGSAKTRLLRSEDAISDFDRALILNPRYPEAWMNRGLALLHLERFPDALASLDQSLALKPDHAETWFNRGNVLLEMRNLHQASESFEKGYVIDPDYAFLIGNIAHNRQLLCDWSQLSEHRSRIAKGTLARHRVCPPFQAIGLFDDPGLLKINAETYAETKFPRRKTTIDFSQSSSHNKVRIGYYSADLFNHATTFLMAEMLESHDHQHFEFFGFSFGPDKQDEMARRIPKAFDHFHSVRKSSDVEVAQLSRELGIDIAVDLKGYTKDSRPGMFAEGCAPIQVNFLGFPGTLGADYFDYIIGDKTLIPVEEQPNYSEKVVYLPHSYQPNDSQRPISEKVFSRLELGLPEDAFVFCCFNNSFKIMPEVFESWLRIASTVEGSVLWLLESNPWMADNLRKEAHKRGFDSNRLVFAGKMAQAEHLSRHRAADLFLDAFPCNAHTTASDALWVGLPVLTRTGRTFASRVAASLLTAVGLPELITTSVEEYECKAIELAQNRTVLAQLKAKLERNRLTMPLFDGKLFAKHLEAAFTAMYDRYQSGQKPDVIEIPALD
jgi:predicted O-linked N-acetylglucosamine transferase (SPINDLY family)